MAFNLEGRNRKILEQVVLGYIRGAGPVGSGAVAAGRGVGISAATVRQVMAQLTREGFLTQPHPSAGRVPTMKGLRFYVDQILIPGRVSARQRRAIEEGIDAAGGPRDLAKTGSRVVSLVSRCIGIARPPRISSLALERMEFIRIEPRLVLVVLAARGGLSHQRALRLEEPASQEDLDYVSRYFNDIFRGRTVGQLRERVFDELFGLQAGGDQRLARGLALSRRLFAEGMAEEELFIEGVGNVFSYPEGRDPAAMEALFKAIDEKKAFLEFLDGAMKKAGVSIYIGAQEEGPGLEGWAVITMGYGPEAEPLGSLGILGPARLDYFRLVPLVDYTARRLTQALSQANIN